MDVIGNVPGKPRGLGSSHRIAASSLVESDECDGTVVSSALTVLAIHPSIVGRDMGVINYKLFCCFLFFPPLQYVCFSTNFWSSSPVVSP